MTEPISPDEIRKQSGVTEQALAETINFINRILQLKPSLALLLDGQAVEVYDNSNVEFWQVAAEAAVQAFKDKGWLVTSETVGHIVVYRFSLPEVE